MVFLVKTLSFLPGMLMSATLEATGILYDINSYDFDSMSSCKRLRKNVENRGNRARLAYPKRERWQSTRGWPRILPAQRASRLVGAYRLYKEMPGLALEAALHRCARRIGPVRPGEA